MSRYSHQTPVETNGTACRINNSNASYSPVNQKSSRPRWGRACAVAIFVLFLLTAVAVAIFLLVYFLGPKSEVTVTGPMGSIKGRVVESPQGHSVQQLLGIPFAKPPIGELRYADPVPYGPLTEDPYEADSYKNSCWQYLDTTFGDFLGSDMWNAKNPLSENCLFLNVWAPEKTSKGDKKNVMVWIYGGGFYSGSNQLWVYDGKALADYGDVIVVSMNYRMGSLGFLSTGDGRIKGNFGLKDQQLALLWVQENIEYFGGDPEKVTIFGESAGAASVGYHTFNSISSSTFERAIYQSGSPDAHWAFLSANKTAARSSDLFDALECPNDDAILNCLRNKTIDEIMAVDWVTSEFLDFPWAPSIDGEFITDSPYNLLRTGKFAHKDTLLGTNLDEGTFWILYTLPGFSKDDESLHNYTMYLEGVKTIAWDLSQSELENIQTLYSPENRSDLAANRDALDDVCGDRSFTCPTLALADTLSGAGVSVHSYFLTHRASNEVWPPWMGVIHGADIQWVFGMPLNVTRQYSQEEMEFSRALMDYWVAFAKTGDPNSAKLPQWPVYSSDGKEYLEFSSADPTSFRTGQRLKAAYCPTWDTIHRRRSE